MAIITVPIAKWDRRDSVYAGYPPPRQDPTLLFAEQHHGPGLPSFTVIGAPGDIQRDARDLVRSALIASGSPWPTHRVTINLAPAPLYRRQTRGTELAMALGHMELMGSLPPGAMAGVGVIGELRPDGTVESVHEIAPLMAVLVDAARTIIVPQDNLAAAQTSAAAGVTLIPATSLPQLRVTLTARLHHAGSPERMHPNDSYNA